MALQITANLMQILPLQTGASKNGPWKKQDIILETATDKYPKKVCISIWGDKIDENLLVVGNQLTVSFEVESREYNGKWYTDIKAWKIEKGAGNSNTNNTSKNNNSNENFVGESFSENLSGGEEEQLPF